MYPVLFEADRRARLYEELASTSRGELVRVRSAASIEAALPALVSRGIRSVYARNETNGAETGNIYDAEITSFEGVLPVVLGANDVELRIQSDRGTTGLFRFRVYVAPGHLEGYLAELRERNQGLEVRAEELADQMRGLAKSPKRSVAVSLEDAAPAALDER